MAFKRFAHSLNENVKIFIADYQGVVQGCAVVPFSGHSAYYLYGGSVQESTNRINEPASMGGDACNFASLAVNRYDFVGSRINPEKGSKQEGLTMFKQRFGGQLVQGYMWKYSIRTLQYLRFIHWQSAY